MPQLTHLNVMILTFIILITAACGGGDTTDLVENNDRTAGSGNGDANEQNNPAPLIVNNTGTDSGNEPQIDPSKNTIAELNSPPTEPAEIEIDLGADITLYNDEPLTLTSTAADPASLTYQWRQVSGENVTFLTPNAASTNVVYPKAIISQTYEFELTVSNGAASGSDRVTVTALDRIEEAAKIGDPSLLPTDVLELEQRILTMIAAGQIEIERLHQTLFGSSSINFNPSRSSRFFTLADLMGVVPVVTGNAGKVFITALEEDDRRAVAVGDNILVEMQSDAEVHTDFVVPMINIINWLLTPHEIQPSESEPIQVALMLLSSSHMNLTQAWLENQFEHISVSQCTDENQLSGCLSGAHLIITGSNNDMAVNSVSNALDQALINKQSLLYTHNQSWNSTDMTNPVLAYFAVQTQNPGNAGNYWTQDSASWSSAAEMRAATDVLNQVSHLVTRFKEDSFSFEIDACDDNNSACNNIAEFNQEFLSTAELLRNTIKFYDENAMNIFAIPQTYSLEKLLILLGDQYRQSVAFPMSKDTSNTLAFLKSYFADHLVYTHREYNPVQADLGNFSRTDFSHITPTTKVVNVTSRQNFRAAGVYALPGKTMTVTRTDNASDVSASIYINSIRHTSTQLMDPDDGYNRPKFLESHHIPIQAGQTITLTSPYGGPVQIEFTNNGTDMQFTFNNIGLHPYWRTGDDDIAFLTAVDANAFDWVEIASEHFEIHSTHNKIIETLDDDSRWDTPSELEYFLTKYHHNYFRVGGGFQGENIDIVDEIQDFASSNNLVMATWDKVHHMNADQPTCGYGCSGNPYDAGWAFHALGHGDLHEVGHTIEDARFKFNGFEGHATTNLYSYYAKSRAQVEDAVAANCQSLKFSDYDAHLQAGDDINSLGYTGWNYGVTLLIELMMHAEENNVLTNGWHLVPRLHILSREYKSADNNDTSWNDTKDNLGFSSYTRSEAINIDNNDWLLVAASFATGLDYRPFFDLMDLSYSTKANDQVHSFAFPAVERAFFLPLTNNSYCDSLSGHEKRVY